MLVAGGERGGKSFVSGLFGATRTPYGERFWIVAATYELARPEFGYWVDFLTELGAIRGGRDVSVPKIGKAVALTKTGQIIETKTADDVKKLAAVAPDGIVIAEAAQCEYETYLKCVGRVAEKRGWVLMSGTFEGSLGWYAEKFTEWQNPNNLEGGKSYSLPSWSNRHIYPEGRQDPEILRLESIYSRVEGLFDERCGAVPVPPSTLIFREFRHTVHVSEAIQFNPKLPVYLAVDPSSGGDPYCVLVCQFEAYPYSAPHPDTIDYCNVIDGYYETQINTEDIVAQLSQRKWWRKVAGGAIDIEAPDERRRWLKQGHVNLISKKIDQFAGIRRLKSFLHYRRDPQTGLISEQPHLRIAPSVTFLPYEFTRYKRKIITNDVAADDPFGHMVDKPPQNQADHAIKALWYLLVARYGDVKSGYTKKVAFTWTRPRL